MGVIADVVDHERFERFEEQPGGTGDAGHAVALLAHHAPQFLQHEIGAGDIFAAQHATLKLADQQQARLRRHFPQELPQSFDRVGARHRPFYPPLDQVN